MKRKLSWGNLILLLIVIGVMILAINRRKFMIMKNEMYWIFGITLAVVGIIFFLFNRK